MAETAKLIAAYPTVEASHKKLAQVLAAGKHPEAECRINLDSESPYEVWSSHSRIET